MSKLDRRFDKLKPSRHQQEHLDNGDDGHELATDQAMRIVMDPILTDTQADGRDLFWGYFDGKLWRVVVSAAVSSSVEIGRFVTGHRSRLPRWFRISRDDEHET